MLDDRLCEPADEEGPEYIEDLLVKAEKEDVIIYIAFITLTEVFYITMHEKGEPDISYYKTEDNGR